MTVYTSLPTTITGSSGGTVTQLWTNLSNLSAIDTACATQTPQGFSVDSVISATGYNFAIPGGETILGVTVTIGRFRSGGAAGEIHDDLFRIIKAGTPGGTNFADDVSNWPTTLTAKVYGGSANLLGNTLTASDVNNSGFGLQLRLYADLPSTRVANIDYAQLDITTDGVVSSGFKGLMLMGCGT